MSESNQVNVIVEYPDTIDHHTKFMVTLKTADEINTNEYNGDLINALIHMKIEELFALLNIIDSFGFVEVDMRNEEI